MGFECRRCGNCCKDVGRTFWKNGDFNNVPELNVEKNNGDWEDGGLPCAMLRFDTDGKAVCLIHRDYGEEYKPDVCREHQGDMRCAHKQKAIETAIAAIKYAYGVSGVPPRRSDCVEAIGVLNLLSGEGNE